MLFGELDKFIKELEDEEEDDDEEFSWPADWRVEGRKQVLP